MHAYLTRGLVPESLKLFSLLLLFSLDSASCNILLTGFSNLGLLPELQTLFISMLSLSSAKSNSLSLPILLAVCAKIRNFLSGNLIHSYAVKSNLESETLIGNSLISMYSKSGIIPTKIFHQISPKDAISFNLSEIISVGNSLMAFYCRVGEYLAAEQVFRRLSSPDVVSWNTMISGSAINGCHHRALELFRDLGCPDKITLVSILPVFAHLGKILERKIVHAMAVVSQELERETALKNALVSFYVKIRRLNDAFSVFSQIENKDLVSWNSILAGLSSKKAELLTAAKNMQVAGFLPDAITIFSLLHAGFTRELHGFSVREGFMGWDDVANSLADTYSRLRFTDYAIRLCKTRDFRVSGRKTMISIFMRHGMIHDAEKIFDHDGDDDEWMMMIHRYAQNGLPHHAIAAFVDFCRRRVPGAAAVTSVLPACARLASMQLVRQCHAFSLRLDFVFEPHLVAALVDSYCKCGRVDFAPKIFSMIEGRVKDLVCYTAMATGYAINGMTSEALTLFHEMAAEGIQADHVSMTAMISACSHGELFQRGR